MMLTGITKEFLYEVYNYINENKALAKKRLTNNEFFPAEPDDFYHYVLMGVDQSCSDEKASVGELAWNMAAEKLYNEKEIGDLKKYYENYICMFEMEAWEIIDIMDSYGFFDEEKTKKKNEFTRTRDEFFDNFKRGNKDMCATNPEKFLYIMVDAWLEIADFI